MNLAHSAITFAVFVATAAAAGAEISFNRDIRPILSDNCFSCHGPDKPARKGDRRLDTPDGATAEVDGVRAIVPGDVAHSELVARITSTDRDEVMPPPKSEKQLKPEQIALLKQWIAEGARYESHWAFIPATRPPLPQPADRAPGNPIDAFIQARLSRDGLTLATEASRTTLIRRVTYDLTGLPPQPAEIDAFLADDSPQAYERLVDRLLASPRYGEKMAVHWLDLSRYADTHGFHLDAGREMWRWRDWVIDAFNRNQRYDEFVVWQLAGDLLPNATIEQKLATGFVRNNMVNFEGGAIAEEYLAAYVKDRVATTATAFLGLTVACAECHDHKFDPITQREYYQFYAYFNAVPEKGLDGSKGNAAPVLELPSPEQTQRIADLQKQLARVDQQVAIATAEQQAVDSGGEPWTLPKALTEPAARLRKEVETAKAQVPNVMVMAQMAQPRTTHLLLRGQYNQPGESVTPGTPASLLPLAADAPPNRLGLARWLVDPQNPLTARVTVNRFWKNLLGTGIVKTLNDFGSQAEWPSHPELLDWLATEFVESGWDVKRLVRLIVTSDTYRQDARMTRELRERDPENRLYARGPRFRLSGEEIRDTALAVSGLLNQRIGGASVSPYQPEGIWEELSSRGDSKQWTAQFYEQSHGPDLYRRSMYTFWKRTCPPPQLQTFDAPDRETCVVSRERTNTPLQALVLLNDPTYVEAARLLAERMITEGGATPVERVRFAFRLTTARLPSEAEVSALLDLFEKQRSRYAPQPAEAAKLLSQGEHPRNAALDPAELAAWTLVASTLLNLDETVTKG
ncbi:MAG TPA: PSD1 and planctomycete cytochrome C domain-containing protein [Chthoniobacteraceae bacterium]|nr:PSD1 and planctomycete cytochrome C domain-containing protein [Chthoniobacteraceae bacterium]